MIGEPTGVFISYSHKDEAWKDRLVSHLRVLELEGALDVWDDRQIAAGDDWRPAIEEAIARARVAILIVSKDFLTSRFIREQELKKILAGRLEGRLRVVPLIAEPCAWQAVGVLQGIEARPRDGRPLSAGNEHQIDTDLSELAVEVTSGRAPQGFTVAAAAARASVQTRQGDAAPLSAVEGSPVPAGQPELSVGLPVALRPTGHARPIWLAGSLAGSAALAALVTIGSTYWPIGTRVSLDLVTARVSFVVRGTKQTLDPDVKFSALTLERCARASFEGVEFVSARTSIPRPAIRFVCRDSDAKIRITGKGDAGTALGSLGAMSLEPGSGVAIAIIGGQVPVLTLEMSGRALDLDVPLERDVDVVTDLAELDPASGTAALGLERYTGTLRKAPRHAATLQTSDRGAVLVLALADGTIPLKFAGSRRLPVASVQLDRETQTGTATSALLEDGLLSYTDYPKKEPRPISQDDGLVLERISDAHLRELRIETASADGQDATKLGLKLSIEGVLERGEIGAGDAGAPGPGSGRWNDLRLTLYDVLTYGRWRMAGLASAWAVATLWTAYLGWKKLSL